MLDLEQIKDRLKDRTLTKVAEGCGISYVTMLKVANGPHKQITYDVVKRVSDYLEGNKNNV